MRVHTHLENALGRPVSGRRGRGTVALDRLVWRQVTDGGWRPPYTHPHQGQQ